MQAALNLDRRLLTLAPVIPESVLGLYFAHLHGDPLGLSYGFDNRDVHLNRLVLDVRECRHYAHRFGIHVHTH